jgi:spore coat protein CotH
MRTRTWALFGGFLILFAFTSCYKETFIASGTGLDDWTFSTHSGLASANYSVVFDQTKVNRLDFVIEEEDWEIMQDNLEDIVGSTSNGGGGGQGGTVTFSEETPVYVKTQMYFNSIQWYDVGIRYKGNSSLTSGSGKLPFRLKMNEFEGENLAITNQKFYGFQELSLSNNMDDASFLREKVTCDLFREAGVPAPQTAFYEIYVDHGDGPVYFGLYTAVEVVSDNMVKAQFGSDAGNIYKPDGDAASFQSGTFDITELEKKNNESSDWSDIENLYNILNSSTRTSDVETWKDNLEAVLNVDEYLNWLAINTTVQNWDTYGNMTHNYYLYVNHTDGKFNWIPWDNNEALQAGKQNSALPFNFIGTTNGEWPLIEYLYAQSEYKSIYDQHITNFITNVFTTSAMHAKYDYWKNLISASVYKESSGYTFLSSSSAFESAITTLKSHVTNRVSAAVAYL